MESSQNLTKYPEGSIRELWSISMPLMISILATLFMVFVDRCFLAHYSIQTLNASVSSGTLAWAFLGGICTLTAMSEVFVSQYNGADQKSLMGVPVWQMIWVSIFSLALFIPLSIWGHLLFSESSGRIDLQATYFKTLIMFGPSYALITAFSGFYIGRGKTRLLIVLALAANILNACLDWALIFGVSDLIPEMGIRGAAIATGIGASFQSLILGILFFRKKNRKAYGTGKWHFNFPLFKKCLKVGAPPALNVFLEIIAWAIFYIMMTSMGEEYIMISSICQSFIILFCFYHEGLSRGIIAIVGNFIGARCYSHVYKVIRSAIILQLGFVSVIGILLGFYPEVAIQFFSSNELLQEAPTSALSVVLNSAMKNCLILVAVSILFEGMRWIFSGVLTAAGDTLFILIMGSISVWIFLLLPLYFIVVQNHLPVEAAWILTTAFTFLVFLFFWMRYRSEKWKKIDLLEEEKPEDLLQEQTDLELG